MKLRECKLQFKRIYFICIVIRFLLRESVGGAINNLLKSWRLTVDDSQGVGIPLVLFPSTLLANLPASPHCDAKHQAKKF